MRVTFVIQAMGPGGAERVMATMANAWAAKGWPVTLLTLAGEAEPFYELDRRIAFRPLTVDGPSGNPVRAVANNLRRVGRLRRAIAESAPDVVISFLDAVNVLTLLATIGRPEPVIVEEHTDPAAKRLSRPWHWLRALAYRRAARVVVLSEAAGSAFTDAIRRRTVVIPNPVVVPAAGAAPAFPAGGRRTVASLGRLVPDKRFDLLIEAFARLAPRFPDWDLVIWGDGPLRGELEALRGQLGMTRRIFLPGITRSPHVELRRADLFALSSRREGFPMALCEALACGLPVVAADCESGPRQIVRPGIDGLLVSPGDAAALADGLAELMGNDQLRAAYAARAPEVTERFGLERVMAMWEALVAELRAPGESSVGAFAPEPVASAGEAAR